MFALLWVDALSDPRLQTMQPALYKHWVRLLLIARQHNHDGELPPLDDVAYTLRCSSQEAIRALELLSELGLIEQSADAPASQFAPGSRARSYRLHNWAARQDPELLLGKAPARIAASARSSRNHRAIIAQRNRINEITSTVEVNVEETTNGVLSTNVRERDDCATNHASTEQAARNRAAGDTRGRFDDWYAVYPRHQDRKRALEAWLKLAPSPDLADVIIRATLKQVAVNTFGDGFWPYPTTYLNGERWNDEPAPPAREVRHAGPRRGARTPEGQDTPADSWGDDEPAT